MTHDYYLRLQPDELNGLCFEHLSSAVDLCDSENALACTAEGASASALITGFTEWVSVALPAHSIGWDWVVQGPQGRLVLRPHSIRTNIMLLDADGQDVGRQATELAIAELIAGWNWPALVLQNIAAGSPVAS